MRESLPAAGCRDTPKVTAFDARELAVREIGYWRDPSRPEAEPCIERHCYGAARLCVSSIDARLFRLAQAGKAAQPIAPNFRYGLSLSGRQLRVDSVDAGERITMYCTTGSVRRTRDARGSEQSRDYDVSGRPIAVHESLAGEAVHCVERLSYGECDAAAAAANRRGRLWRHDEPIGSKSIDTYALGGEPMRECLRLLSHDDVPDWPCEAAIRDGLLEPSGGYITCRRFGALGDLLAQIDAKGNTQSFGYSVAGQQNAVDVSLASSASHWIPVASGMTYNAAGQLTRSCAGNGVITEYRYEPADGRLVNFRARRPEAAKVVHEAQKGIHDAQSVVDELPKMVQDIHYRYDPVGNVVRREDRAGCAAPRRGAAQKAGRRDNAGITAECGYSYDSLYRLIDSTGREMAAAPLSLSAPGASPATHDLTRLSRYRRQFSYDMAGNLTGLQHQSAATRASFTRRWTIDAGSNRVASNQGADGAEQRNEFDAMGNQQRSQGGKLLAWDARNQLRQVMSVAPGAADDPEGGLLGDAANGPFGECERYGYDGSGQRVRKIRQWPARGVTHGEIVDYLPGLELRANSATGEQVNILVVNSPCPVRIFHWESSPPSGLKQDHIRYSLIDHLGSSTQELNDRAQSISYEEYYAFGSTAFWATSSVLEGKYKTIRYSGRERDATGFYYYGFRYYDPGFCRWLNPDPAGTIDGLNLFCFVQNNPVTWRDADGRSRENRKLGFIYVPFADKDAVAFIIGLNAQKVMVHKAPMGVLVDTEQDKADLMAHLATLQNEDQSLRWGNELMEAPSEVWKTYDPAIQRVMVYAFTANQLQSIVLSAERDGVFGQLEPGKHKLHVAAHGDLGGDSLSGGSLAQPKVRSIASVADAMTRGNGLRAGFDDIRLISCYSAEAFGNNRAPAQILADRLGESGLANITVTGYRGKRAVHAMKFGDHKTQLIESGGPARVRSSEARVRFRRANFTLRY